MGIKSDYKYKRRVTCAAYGDCPGQGESCKAGAVFEGFLPGNVENSVSMALTGKPAVVAEPTGTFADEGEGVGEHCRAHAASELELLGYADDPSDQLKRAMATQEPVKNDPKDVIDIRDLLKGARIDKSLN